MTLSNLADVGMILAVILLLTFIILFLTDI